MDTFDGNIIGFQDLDVPIGGLVSPTLPKSDRNGAKVSARAYLSAVNGPLSIRIDGGEPEGGAGGSGMTIYPGYAVDLGSEALSNLKITRFESDTPGVVSAAITYYLR